MSNKKFLNQWKVLKCDLCGRYEVLQDTSEITIEDVEGRVRLRACQRCEEKIFDILSILCTEKDANNER